ncbi:MAG: sulfatase-like hydrolase/transferase [Acidobacteriota bacterium]
MSLSVSTAALDRLKDALFCLSLGSLCFIRRWFDLDVLRFPSLDFYRSAPRDSGLMVAALTSSSILALAFWLVAQLVRRLDNPRLTAIARCANLLAIIYAIESMRRYWISEIGMMSFTSNSILMGIEIILAVGAGMALMGNPRILHVARTVGAVVGLLIPASTVELAWGPQTAVSAFLPKAELPPLPKRPAVGKTPATRVVWLLFDEFDQHLAFDERPAGLELPELDRLRSESLIANRVLQTGNSTVVAIPSLLSGQAFESTSPVDARTLLVQPAGSKTKLPWRDLPNIFQQARRLGANTSLTGWQLPYCRVIGNSLVHCFDQPGGHPANALLREIQASESGVWDNVGFLFYMQTQNLLDMFRPPADAVSPDIRDAFVQRRQLQQYFAIRDHAYREIADPQMGLVFVHFPTPHMFAIYDRHRADFVLSADTSYLDNLALVDRTVGEVRRSLETAGLWESTTLMITSDHAVRPTMWHNRYNWSPAFESLIGPGASRTVPFILKLAGHHEGTVYEPSLSNLTATQLGIAALSGNVTTPQQAVAWLKKQTPHPLVSER